MLILWFDCAFLDSRIDWKQCNKLGILSLWLYWSEPFEMRLISSTICSCIGKNSVQLTPNKNRKSCKHKLILIMRSEFHVEHSQKRKDKQTNKPTKSRHITWTMTIWFGINVNRNGIQHRRCQFTSKTESKKKWEIVRFFCYINWCESIR